jgi:2-keto-4-pentenoate hydratase
MKLTSLLAGTAAVLLGAAAHAACLTDAQAARLAEHYFARTPAPDLEAMSEADAHCSRAKFNALLAQRLGPAINSAIWLARALVQEGLALKPGQFISLGSFPPVMPPPRGREFVVTYQGLPGAQPVAVHFDD